MGHVSKGLDKSQLLLSDMEVSKKNPQRDKTHDPKQLNPSADKFPGIPCSDKEERVGCDQTIQGLRREKANLEKTDIENNEGERKGSSWGC